MQRSSGHLRIISIVFSALLAITGCILLVFAVIATQAPYKDMGVQTSVIQIIMVALTVISLSCLAVYGAYKEKPALLTGLVAVILASCVVMVIAVDTTVSSTQQLMQKMHMNVDWMEKLALSDVRLQNVLHNMETQNRCCGVLGYSGYMKNNKPIPSSCRCSSGSDCTLPSSYHDDTYGDRRSNQNGKNNKDTKGVYHDSCLSFFIQYLYEDIQERMERVNTSLSVMALLGFLLCSALLLQISRQCDPQGRAAAPVDVCAMSPSSQMGAAAQPQSSTYQTLMPRFQ